jgi:uncharacterized hydrophobic protein (TIGR00341 family)
MAFRLLQIFVPEKAAVDMNRLLENCDLIGTLLDSGAENRIILQLLVRAEDSETIMDKFESAFSGIQGFRLVLIPVDVALPRPQNEKDTPSPSQVPNDNGETKEKELQRISREELYNDINETLGLNRVFFALTILSSIVAAVGLLRNDVAIIIGAMVIAPLLGPNVAMALATTLGDLGLLRRAIITNLGGVGLVLLFSVLLGIILKIDPTIPAIAVRTNLGFSDLTLALAAGSAGTFAFTRGLAGAVIGVMVAVALMPPLVTLGMLLGSGQFALAFGAFLLVMANVICINLAGVATFLVQGVHPRTWWEKDRAKKSTRTAIITLCILLLVLAAVLYTTHLTGFGTK